MKQAIGFGCISLIAFGLVQFLSPQPQAQDRSGNRRDQFREGVCFFTDENYRGESYCAGVGENRGNVGTHFNDRFSSVRVFGGSRVVVYADEGFGGSRTTFTSDVQNLGNWNDRITSFQVIEDRQFGGPYSNSRRDRQYGRPYEDQGRGYEPRDGICFYTDDNYRGERFCAESGETIQNVEDHYNDRFSSVRVFGRAQVIAFEDEGFRGARRTYDHDTPNMGNWNDRITSFQVTGGRQSDRRSEEWGRGTARRNGACFYTDENYRGDSFCLNVGDRLWNVGNRYNDKVSSIQVFDRARVIIYEDENFSGDRQTITRDVPNLGDFNDKLTSVELR